MIAGINPRNSISKNNLRVEKNINIEAVQTSLDNIFSWIPGERVLNPEFGNNLYKYLYEGITEYTEELIVAEIKNCVLRWEPRVSIINVYNVSTVQDTEDNTIVLDIEYYINGLEGTIYRKEYRFNRNEE
jgi:phage baseplate assembly protein W